MNFLHIDSRIKCPYYSRVKLVQKRKSLVCESEIEKGMENICVFESDVAFNKHLKKYCMDGWQQCPHTKAIESKYDKKS